MPSVATSRSDSPTSVASGRSTSGATNVGIKAIEIYIPKTCVDQIELEKFDGVSEGKYTIGLGQKKMSFCDDREDIYSMCLTAVSSLLKKYDIDRTNIGRLSVGTETLLDKSKSVKTVLMELFSDVNTDIEGVDNINACYGGTSALLNAISWIESASWDGRDAIVVAGDIATYSRGSARPTGGAGVVAMLVGADAPLAMTGLRGSYFAHAYDFYKADFRSEYPIVQGHYSMQCYTRALDACYTAYKNKERRGSPRSSYNGTPKRQDSGSELTSDMDKAVLEGAKAAKAQPDGLITDRFDYMCFHAPMAKLVNKSFSRLFYNDFKAQPDHPSFKEVDHSILDLEYEASLTDRSIEKTFLSLSKDTFNERVAPSTLAPTMCGNMYTASVYSGLASLLSVAPPEDLLGKTIGIFSYGSGLASTLFSLKVVGDTSEMKSKLDLVNRLAARDVQPPQQYEAALDLREAAHLQNSYTPTGDIAKLAQGTYYLKEIDDQYRRTYAIAV